MKATQLVTRNGAGCSMVVPLEQALQITREFPDSGLVVIDNAGMPVRSITDRDLARAAFTQAVALYDSCVEYAMTFRLDCDAQRSRAATAGQ